MPITWQELAFCKTSITLLPQKDALGRPTVEVVARRLLIEDLTIAMLQSNHTNPHDRPLIAATQLLQDMARLYNEIEAELLKQQAEASAAAKNRPVDEPRILHLPTGGRA